MTSIALTVVVCGWHFNNSGLYDDILSDTSGLENVNVDLNIVSHRKKNKVPEDAVEKLEEHNWNILWAENEGWDWGAFQQYIRWEERQEKRGDYYLFLQDDIHLLKPGFIQSLLDKAGKGAKVVGNSPSVAPEKQRKDRYPEDFLLAESHGISLTVDKWNVVRGSCVFMTREVAYNILRIMPIRRGKRIELANSSLRIFGAMVTEQYGLEGIQYLGDTPRSSEFLYEEFRGDTNKKSGIRGLVPPSIKKRLRAIRNHQKVDSPPPGSGLRLNLGCGNDPLPGYFNIDLTSSDSDPSPEAPGDDLNPYADTADYFNASYADMDADLRSLEFPEKSVAEVMMIHVIEHIYLADVEPLLRKFHSWLIPGGQLILEFPDILKASRLLQKLKHDPKKLTESPFGLSGIFGGYRSPRGHQHQWGWTGITMKKMMQRAGFSEVFVERAQFHVPKRDTRIKAVK